MESCERENAPRPNEILAEAMKGVIGFMRKELILRGGLFLLLGLQMLFKPALTMLAITIVVGAFILLDGVALLFSALKYHGNGKGILLANAVLFILLGIVTCANPLMMNVIWVILFGFWQLFSGINCLGYWKQAGSSAAVSGICGIISGLFLICMPAFGLVALMWLLGVVSFLSGLSAILLGIRLRKAGK